MIIKNLHKKIQKEFQPSVLEIFDDSKKHSAHLNSEEEVTHLRILIKSEAIEKLTRLEKHKAIKTLVYNMLPNLHSLVIKIIS